MKKPEILLHLLTLPIVLVLINVANILHSQIVVEALENDLTDGPVCENPNNKSGMCIPITECKPLLYVLRYEVKHAYTFLRQSQCFEGSGQPPYVCCSNDTEFTQRTTRIIFPDENNTVQNATKDDPITLPRPPNCGLITIGNRIFGGEETKLTEFSWMVNLEYTQKNGEKTSVCAGSLINKKYVLTAAHCVQGRIEEIGQLVSVRVGEHNTETDIDCDNIACLAPVQVFNIEAKIVHEGFKDDAKSRTAFHHDIALLRLTEDVIFTDALQPGCLPEETQMDDLEPGTVLTVAGWGHNGTVTSTAEKRKVNLPLVDKDSCRQKFARHLDVFDEQICVGGLFRKDSCSGDSGGPLMRVHNGGWVIEGLVSFGKGCGVERPAIYTYIRKYIQWIKEHMEV